MVIKIDSIVNDISLSRNIEQSIYNYIIKLSKEKNIQRTWNNTIFAKLYNSKIISISSRRVSNNSPPKFETALSLKLLHNSFSRAPTSDKR